MAPIGSYIYNDHSTSLYFFQFLPSRYLSNLTVHGQFSLNEFYNSEALAVWNGLPRNGACRMHACS